MDSHSPEKRPPGANLQFSLGLLITITLIVALGSLAARHLLFAWESPRRRAAFVMLVVMLPTLAVCAISLLYRLWSRWNR